MHYYSRHVGDYAKDTRHLSMIEHGAYTLLLDYAYATERGLPENPEEIFRITSSISEQEQQAVLRIVSEFFKKGRNKRVKAEIFKFNDRSAKAKASAQLSVDVRSAKAKASVKQRARASTNHSPIPNNHEPLSEGVSELTLVQQAEKIYEAYPRRVGRAEALKKITKAIGHWGFQDLLTATVNYAGSVSGGEMRFIPHPGTWFHQQRYADDPATWGVEFSDSEKNGAVSASVTEITRQRDKVALETERENLEEWLRAVQHLPPDDPEIRKKTARLQEVLAALWEVAA